MTIYYKNVYIEKSEFKYFLLIILIKNISNNNGIIIFNNRTITNFTSIIINKNSTTIITRNLVLRKNNFIHYFYGYYTCNLLFLQVFICKFINGNLLL